MFDIFCHKIDYQNIPFDIKSLVHQLDLKKISSSKNKSKSGKLTFIGDFFLSITFQSRWLHVVAIILNKRFDCLLTKAYSLLMLS